MIGVPFSRDHRIVYSDRREKHPTSVSIWFGAQLVLGCSRTEYKLQSAISTWNSIAYRRTRQMVLLLEAKRYVAAHIPWNRMASL